MSDKDFEEIAERFCDGYCKFPYECANEDELQAVCENCPINKLEELVNE